jgi:thymidine phosphorylase
MALGAGRARVEDRIDHGAGLVLHRKPGDAVAPGAPIVELFYNDDRGLADAATLTREAIRISTEAPRVQPLVLSTVRQPDA